MENLKLRGALGIVCLVLAACSSEPAAPDPQTEETGVMTQPQIKDVLWRLQKYPSESGEMLSPLEGTTVELEFGDGDYRGTSGCNRYFGSYTLEGENRLSLGSEMGTTQMACPPAVMDMEGWYMTLFGQVTTVDRVVDRLTLMDSAGETLLEFVATQTVNLESTQWQAAGINNGKDGVVSSATTSLSTALFAEGQLSGTGGCNQFTASYELDGDQITIGPAAATRMFCADPEGIMDQEQQYFAALERASTLTLTPEKLDLRDPDGALQVSFSTSAE